MNRIILLPLLLLLVAGSNASAQTISGGVPLSGGVSITAPSNTPVSSLSSSSLAFGNIPQNFLSSPQVLTVTNTGTATLTFTSIVPPTGYSESDTCGASIAAGANCAVTLTFNPTLVQTYSGNLVVTTNYSASPQNVALTGTGVTTLLQADFTGVFPAPYTNQNIPAGGSSQTQVVTPLFHGTNAAELYYTKATVGDVNNWMGAVLGSTCTDCFRHGYIYLDTPNVGETSAEVDKKLFWISDSGSASNNLGTHQAILNCFQAHAGVPDPNGCWLAWLTQATGGGGCSISANAQTGLYFIAWRTWTEVEVEWKMNTPGGSDGTVKVWAGTPSTFSQSGSLVYSNTATGLVNGTCSGAFSAVADGEQSNTTSSHPGVTDEQRYWQDISTATVFVGRP